MDSPRRSKALFPLLHTKPGLAGLNVIALLVLASLGLYYNRQYGPSADVTGTITTTAQISYCTIGDAGPKCDPVGNRFTNRKISNSATVSIKSGSGVTPIPSPSIPPYPSPEVTQATPPPITPNTSAINATSATVTGTSSSVSFAWTLSAAGSGKLYYGTDANTLNLATAVTQQTKLPRLKLAGLIPNTRYFYQFIATTVDGKTYTSKGSFVTQGGDPSIASYAQTIVPTTVKLSPVTTLGQSRVAYGTSPSQLTQETPLSTRTTNPAFTLTGLAPQTTYYYKIITFGTAPSPAFVEGSFTTQ